MKKKKHQVGDKVGWWSLLELTDSPTKSKQKRIYWLCKCKCGTIKPVAQAELQRGHSKSCGCRWYKRNSIYANIKTRYPTGHKLHGSSVYILWNTLLQKCYNKEHIDYKNYGAKGYTVCDSWRRAPNFIKWAKDTERKNGDSLDIKKDQLIFSPDTCFWLHKNDKISKTRRLNRKDKYKDLVGKRFGHLIIKGESDSDGKRKRLGLICICDCGKEKLLSAVDVVRGFTQTCGCKGKKYDWSANYEKCILCSRTKFKHAANGLCFQCYRQKLVNNEYTPSEHLLKENRWAIYYDCCVECNKTTSKHHARGICRTCKSRKYYNLKKSKNI